MSRAARAMCRECAMCRGVCGVKGSVWCGGKCAVCRDVCGM